MNLERITQPIQSESIEKHEELLEDKLTEIKLEYVDRLFSKKIPSLKGEEELLDSDFDFLLVHYTSVVRDLMSYHITQEKNKKTDLEITSDFETYNPVGMWNSEMYDPAEAQFKDKIISFYKTDHDHWIEKTMQLLLDEREKAESVDTREISLDEEEDEKHGTAGILNFDVDSGYKFWFNDSEVSSSIEDEDTCISIHLQPLYKKTLHDKNTNIFSSNSLEKLAVEIVDKFPETKAIIAESWIMDTPIAERIGFKIYKKGVYRDTYSFWGQFVNSNGQIDNANVKKFLETGEAPFSVATGAIMTEDFLKKYLPKERRGKIILKEVKKEIYQEWLEEKKALNDIFDNWEIKTESEIEHIIISSALVKKFDDMGMMSSSLLSLMRNFKNSGKLYSEFMNDPMFLEYKKVFRSFLYNIEFTNKEVFIE